MFFSRRALLRLLAVAGLLALLSGCGGDDNTGASAPTNNGPVTSAPRQSNGLEFTLSANKSVYAVGEHVVLTLSVTNRGSQPIVAGEFGGLADPRYFAVFKGQQRVWFYPQTGTGGGVGRTVTYAPSETQTYTVEWDQTNGENSQALGAGQYTLLAGIRPFQLNGAVTTQETRNDLLSSSINIVIQ